MSEAANTNATPPSTAIASDPADVLKRLPDAQVFSRDPEDYSKEDIADTIARLKKVLLRYRAARSDGEAIVANAARVKKLNAAATKKKTKLAADPLDTKV